MSASVTSSKSVVNSMKLPKDGTLELLKLRLAVGAQGEKQGWWSTNSCNPSYKVVLQGLFPRSWRLAAMNATAEAAKHEHQVVVTNRSQHLFRFHTELEQDLRRLLHVEDGETVALVFDEVISHPLESIKELAGKGVHPHVGAISLGEPTRSNILQKVPRMAALYYLAFLNNTKCFPFFDPEETA